MKRLLLALPLLALWSGLASAKPEPRQQSISFTVLIGAFDLADGNVGGGVCLGNTRATDPREYFGVQWSPDGRKFAFYRHTGRLSGGFAKADVFVADADGSNERNLTAGTGAYNWTPAWSPDGNRIVYGSDTRARDELVVMQADGTGKQGLSATASDDPVSYVARPSWSPDGSTIAYIRASSLWLVGADGAENRMLFANSDNVDWSPDGRRLVIVHRDDLAVANADGSGFTTIVQDAGYVREDPQWSPNGSAIAYVSYPVGGRRYGPGDLYLVDPDGGNPRVLRGPPGASFPTWRPPAPALVGARPCVVAGTRQRDLLRGTARGDLIDGGAGNDVILGGAGNDVLYGGGGTDRILGGAGNDLIDARDKRVDVVNGGSGFDRARVDGRRDRVSSVETRLP